MSKNPALRLVTETLQADSGGISNNSRYRQVVVDGAASLRLRKEIGNDCFSALEVLFILADPSPTGVLIHSATEQLQDILGWGRDKVRTTLRKLQDLGFIDRTQESTQDPRTGKLIFGRGVLTLDVTSVDVVPEESLEPQTPQPAGWGTWGRPLSTEVCRQLLATWGVRGADRLIEDNHTLVSDAVKFVQNSLRTGVPIDNPGAYARALITNKRVAAPDPSVPPSLLTEELTLSDLVGSTPEQRAPTLQRSREAKEKRRRYLDNMLRTGLDSDTRAEIEMLLDDDLRDFAFTSPESREVHRYHLLEERLAERGVLASLPEPEEVVEAADPDEPPF